MIERGSGWVLGDDKVEVADGLSPAARAASHGGLLDPFCALEQTPGWAQSWWRASPRGVRSLKRLMRSSSL